MILEKNLPNNWSIHSVEELFDFINTKSLSRAQLISEEGENQYLHYGDIHSTFKYVLVDTEKIQLPSVLKDVQISGNIEFLKDGDLVIADASEDLDGVAKCIELKNIGVKKVIGGLHTIVCRDKIGKTANEIRPYLFLNTIVLKSIKRIATGTSVLGISKGRLKEIRLILPPLSEQQKIAQILSTVDDKIEIIEQQIIETQELKKGLMRRLLTKGIGHTEFKDSPLGMIPESWEVNEFGENLDIQSGFGFKKADYSDDGYKLLRIDNVGHGKIFWDSIAHIPLSYKDEYSHLILKEGDILIALNRPITQNKLKIGRVKKTDLPSILYQRVGKLIVKDNYSYDFLYFLSSFYLIDFIQKTSIGSDQPFISLTALRKLNLPLPTIVEQHKIAQILTSVDDKLEVLSEKKAHYQELKQGLMQQLLTGKIRVKV